MNKYKFDFNFQPMLAVIISCRYFPTSYIFIANNICIDGVEHNAFKCVPRFLSTVLKPRDGAFSAIFINTG